MKVGTWTRLSAAAASGNYLRRTFSTVTQYTQCSRDAVLLCAVYCKYTIDSGADIHLFWTQEETIGFRCSPDHVLLGGGRYSNSRYSDISEWVMQWVRVRIRDRIRARAKV